MENADKRLNNRLEKKINSYSIHITKEYPHKQKKVYLKERMFAQR